MPLARTREGDRNVSHDGRHATQLLFRALITDVKGVVHTSFRSRTARMRPAILRGSFAFWHTLLRGGTGGDLLRKPTPLI